MHTNEQPAVPEAIPVSVLAKSWHMSEATLRRWLRKRRLAGVRIGGVWLIPVADLRRILSSAGSDDDSLLGAATAALAALDRLREVAGSKRSVAAERRS